MAFNKIRNIIAARKIKHLPVYCTDLNNTSVKQFDDALNGNLGALVKLPSASSLMPVEVIKNVQKNWQNIYQQFIDRTHTNEELRIYLLQGEVTRLKNRYNVCSLMLKTLLNGRPPSIQALYINELHKWNIVIDVKKPLIEECKKAQRQLRHAKTKIELLKQELEEIQQGKKEKMQDYTLTALKIKAKVAINIDVELNTTSMDEWLTIWEEIKQISEAQERQLAKMQS